MDTKHTLESNETISCRAAKCALYIPVYESKDCVIRFFLTPNDKKKWFQVNTRKFPHKVGPMYARRFKSPDTAFDFLQKKDLTDKELRDIQNALIHLSPLAEKILRSACIERLTQ